jgi:hypothetical protein
MADKYSLASFVPYPTRVEDVTADNMARHFTAFAQLHWRIAMDHPDRDKARESINGYTSYYAIAYLLREQPAREGDRVAKELWETWDSGVSVGVDLWEWLTEYGIDPERIGKVAERLISETSTPEPAVDPRQSELPLGGEA